MNRRQMIQGRGGDVDDGLWKDPERDDRHDHDRHHARMARGEFGDRGTLGIRRSEEGPLHHQQGVHRRHHQTRGAENRGQWSRVKGAEQDKELSAKIAAYEQLTKDIAQLELDLDHTRAARLVRVSRRSRARRC